MLTTGALAVGHFSAMIVILLPFAAMTALVKWQREIRIPTTIPTKNALQLPSMMAGCHAKRLKRWPRKSRATPMPTAFMVKWFDAGRQR